jgi:hypothetical protein
LAALARAYPPGPPGRIRPAEVKSAQWTADCGEAFQWRRPHSALGLAAADGADCWHWRTMIADGIGCSTLSSYRGQYTIARLYAFNERCVLRLCRHLQADTKITQQRAEPRQGQAESKINKIKMHSAGGGGREPARVRGPRRVAANTK